MDSRMVEGVLVKVGINEISALRVKVDLEGGRREKEKARQEQLVSSKEVIKS